MRKQVIVLIRAAHIHAQTLNYGSKFGLLMLCFHVIVQLTKNKIKEKKNP